MMWEQPSKLGKYPVGNLGKLGVAMQVTKVYYSNGRNIEKIRHVKRLIRLERKRLRKATIERIR